MVWHATSWSITVRLLGKRIHASGPGTSSRWHLKGVDFIYPLREIKCRATGGRGGGSEYRRDWQPEQAPSRTSMKRNLGVHA